MTTMKRPRLQAVQALSDYRLRLTFIDGSTAMVSLTEAFAQYPGLAPLRDPAVFAGATVIAGEGWTVEWPQVDIQIGADTLWLDAQAQAAPTEDARIFAQWRARHGLSLGQAAQALGLSVRTISAYGTGARAVPHYIALACLGWEAQRKAEG